MLNEMHVHVFVINTELRLRNVRYMLLAILKLCSNFAMVTLETKLLYQYANLYHLHLEYNIAHCNTYTDIIDYNSPYMYIKSFAFLFRKLNERRKSYKSIQQFCSIFLGILYNRV